MKHTKSQGDGKRVAGADEKSRAAVMVDWCVDAAPAALVRSLDGMRCCHWRWRGRKWMGFMKRGLGANALLWAYAASVAGFYALVARRTGSSGVRALPTAEEADAASAAALPRVTIIVPARDEERNIRSCVESLLDQD